MIEIGLYPLLKLTQEYIAENYAAALIDSSKHTELKAYTKPIEYKR